LEAFLASLAVVFLAEMGDKTQLVVLAFAAKYRWQTVLAGMTAGIIAVHSLAVLLGRLAGGSVPPWLMETLAAVLFLAFGIWTLKGGQEGEEEAAPSGRSPFWTVALAFFVGEMGDKTQLAAFTMAANFDSSLMVLSGAVLGMLAADSLGVLCGALLHKRLPERRLRLLSGSLFILLGLLGLGQLWIGG